MDFKTFNNIINGEPRGSQSTTKGINPLDRSSLWPVPAATAVDVEDSVRAAKEAFPGWSQTPYEHRTELLEKFADLYSSHANDFCQLLAVECGRTVRHPFRLGLIIVLMLRLARLGMQR
jgi:acyl-CoA reductase-like NAD-dependent aldehyde dehydrogenase